VPTTRIAYPVNATDQIWKGGLVNIDSTGHATAATDSATDLICVGVAEESVLGGAADGDEWVTVLSGCAFELPAVGHLQNMVGTLMVVVSDNEIGDVGNATNDMAVGTLTRFVSTTKGEVFIPAGGFAAA